MQLQNLRCEFANGLINQPLNSRKNRFQRQLVLKRRPAAFFCSLNQQLRVAHTTKRLEVAMGLFRIEQTTLFNYFGFPGEQAVL